MRLFAAVPLPPQVEAVVKDYSRAARAACPSASFPQAHHATILFMGEKNGSETARISSAIASLSHGDFEIVLKGNGFFPNAFFPRVFVVGAESPGLRSLHAALCEVFSFPKEGFSPHVTIARVKSREQASQLSKFSENFFPETRFNARRACLYSSGLSPQGALHSELACALLKA